MRAWSIVQHGFVRKNRANQPGGGGEARGVFELVQSVGSGGTRSRSVQNRDRKPYVCCQTTPNQRSIAFRCGVGKHQTKIRSVRQRGGQKYKREWQSPLVSDPRRTRGSHESRPSGYTELAAWDSDGPLPRLSVAGAKPVWRRNARQPRVALNIGVYTLAPVVTILAQHTPSYEES